MHKESGVQQGGKFATIQLDIADKKQIASLLEKIPQDLRSVDILGELSPSQGVKKDQHFLTIRCVVCSEQRRFRPRCGEGRRYREYGLGGNVPGQCLRSHRGDPALHQGYIHLYFKSPQEM